MTIEEMKKQGADEIVLETEVTNEAALRLYECKFFFINKLFISIWICER